MKLGIDYTPKGLLADYCIQCTNPENGKVGTWLFIGGEGHKKGKRISPFFPDLLPFFEWAQENGWSKQWAEGRPMCMIKS